MSNLSTEDKIKILGLAQDAVIRTTPEVGPGPTVEDIEGAYRKFEALVTGEEKPKK